METFLTILHVLICVFLILVVLLQTGKGGGMGAAFGGASQSVFGGSGASAFLKKLTAFAAVGFMLTSIVLAYISSSVESSLQEKSKALAEQAAKKESKKSAVPPEIPFPPLDAGKQAVDAGKPMTADAGHDAAIPKPTQPPTKAKAPVTPASQPRATPPAAAEPPVPAPAPAQPAPSAPAPDPQS